MLYSDRLNGFWEEGYFFCAEIRDGRLTVPGCRRKVMLGTLISYDADTIERGERTVLKLRDTALSKNLSGDIMSGAKELTRDGDMPSLTAEDYVPPGESLHP